MTRFPDDTQRLVIVGATGEGKTIAALWHLSYRDFHRMPWLVFNWKREEHIDALPAVHLDLDQYPKSPGVFVYHPKPADEEQVNYLLYRAHEHGNTGVFVDEGYMIGQHSDEFRLLLTQGRSLRCPVITLSQRPTWLDVFTFSESEFYQVFRLQRRKDQQLMAEYVPGYEGARLKPYHSWYYDARANVVTPLAPVPAFPQILRTFERRLRAQRPIAI